jgi:putative spermidine/putrescine transport system permease protein
MNPTIAVPTAEPTAAVVATGPARSEGQRGRRRPREDWARRAGGRSVSVLGFVALAVFIFGPLVWLIIWAFAGTWDYPAFLPQKWSLTWWDQVFATPQLWHSIELSLVFSPIVTLVACVVCLPAAYVFARRSFPLRRGALILLFSTDAFPKIGLYLTIAGLFYTLHIMGTAVGVVLIQLLGTLVFMVWIPAAAFAGVPRSLEEAARDAGAGPVRTFLRVTLPLALPGIFVGMVLAFLASFDEAQGTLLVGAPNYVTMPTQMYSLVNNYPPQAAAVFALLLSVPSVALMLAVRKHVMGGTLARGFELR